MKFNPTPWQVALLTVLLTAVIVAHIWAPTAVAVITSMVSTIIGSIFVNLREPPAPELPSGKPNLRVVPNPPDRDEDA